MGGKMAKLVQAPATSLMTRVQTLVFIQPKERTSSPESVLWSLWLVPVQVCGCTHTLVCVYRCRQNKLKIF